MPEIDFAPEHKIKTDSEFDRLKLKKDEKARIACLEKPTYAWVHTLRAPKIVNGVAVKVLKERKDKSTYTDYDLEYIGRPLCLGDYGVIADKGLDAVHCPVCTMAKNGEQVGPPERRFAMNIIVYKTKSDGTLATPFSCSCVVWGFTDKTYGRLVDIVNENGSLRDHDLVLTCTNEMYQNYDFMPSPKSVWQMDDKITALVTETFTENRVADLERACGRRAERRFIELDLEKVSERWAIASGVTRDDASAGADQATLTEGIEALLNTGAKPGLEAEPVDLGGLRTPPAEATEVKAAEPFDFDAVLKGLDVN